MTNDVKTEEAQRLESIQEFNAKVHQAKMTIENPKRGGTNPHFNSRFATYDDVKTVIDAACKPLGLKYSQKLDLTSARGAAIYDKCGKILMWSYVKDELNHLYEMGEILVTDFDDPQKFGSEETYKRRYLALMDWDLVGEDDDGNAAAEIQETPPAKGNLERYCDRLNTIIKDAVNAGIKQDAIAEYIETHHQARGEKDKSGNLCYMPGCGLTEDEIASIGNYLKTLIDDKKKLGGTK